MSTSVQAAQGSPVEVRLTDQQRPSSYVMHASGAGAPGQVRATVTINLSPDGDGTTLTYSADAVVGGPVAGVGQRMITGVAKRMAGQFFTAIDAELTGTAVPATAAMVGEPTVAATDGSAEPSQAAAPVTYAGSASASGGWVPAEARPLLVGAAGGGVLTLLGVWIGYLLGRRPQR